MKNLTLLFLICFSVVALSNNMNAQEADPLATPPSTDTLKEYDKIYKIVEQMPRFPGCEEMEGSKYEKQNCATKKMLKYIYSKVNYPEMAFEKGEEGMFVGQFVIAKDGQIIQLKQVRSSGSEALDIEAMNALNIMAKEITWSAGMQGGKTVEVLFTLPVHFKLEQEREKRNKKK